MIILWLDFDNLQLDSYNYSYNCASFTMPKDYFQPDKACPAHDTFHHRDCTTVRCEWCEKYNPNYPKPPAQAVVTISDEDTPPGPKRPIPLPSRAAGAKTKPAQLIPGLEQGVGERGRRDHAAVVASRRASAKTGFTAGPVPTAPPPIIEFKCTVCRHTGRSWEKAPAFFRGRLPNQSFAYESFVVALLAEVFDDISREAYSAWTQPDLDTGRWLLASECDKAPFPFKRWEGSEVLLSILKEQRCLISYKEKNPPLAIVHICWQPHTVPEGILDDVGESSAGPTPSPEKPKLKTKTKKKVAVKKEKTEKRPLSSGSLEPTIPAKRLLNIGVATRSRGALDHLKEEQDIKAEEQLSEAESLKSMSSIVRHRA